VRGITIPTSLWKRHLSDGSRAELHLDGKRTSIKKKNNTTEKKRLEEKNRSRKRRDRKLKVKGGANVEGEPRLEQVLRLVWGG